MTVKEYDRASAETRARLASRDRYQRYPEIIREKHDGNCLVIV